MKPSPIISAALAFASLCVPLSLSHAHAGQWIFEGTGNWTDSTKWLNGEIPNGVGAIADFSGGYNNKTVAAQIGNNFITLGTILLGNAADTSNLVSIRTGISGTTNGAFIFDNNGNGALISAIATTNNVFGFGPGASAANRDSTNVQLKDDLLIERKGTGNLLMQVNLSITDGESHAIRILDTSEAGGAINFQAAYAGASNGSVLADGNGVLSVIQESSKTALWLHGVNTYTGGTVITNGGTVSVLADSGLGDVSGALRFTGMGGTLLVKDTVAFSSERNIILDGNGVLDFSTGGSSLQRTVDSVISGDGALTIKTAGTGNVLLAGNNTYTGGTTIATGSTLAIIAQSALGAVSGDLTFEGTGGTLLIKDTAASSTARNIVLNGDGILDFSQGGTALIRTFSGVISGDGALTVKGANWFGSNYIRLTGNNTYEGGTIIDRARIDATSNSNLGALTGSVTLKNTGSLVLGATNTAGQIVNRTLILTNGGGQIGFRASTGTAWEWQGQITGNGRLTKYIAGDMIISNNANDYTGGTMINEGRLVVNNTTGSGTGTGDVTVSGSSAIAGFGSVAGNVSMKAGTSIQSGYGNTGGFTIGSLTLEGDITLKYADVVGALNIIGQFDAANFDILVDLTGYTGGAITLIEFASLLNADADSFNLTGLDSSVYSLELDTVGNRLLLNMIPEPATAGLLLGVGALALCVVRGRRRNRE